MEISLIDKKQSYFTVCSDCQYIYSGRKESVWDIIGISSRKFSVGDIFGNLLSCGGPNRNIGTTGLLQIIVEAKFSFGSDPCKIILNM